MIFGSLVLYWGKWPLTGKVILIMAVGLPVWAWYEIGRPWKQGRKPLPELLPHLKAGAWMVIYLLVMAAVSYLGGKEFGGKGYLPQGVDLAVVAAIALAFYFWGVRSAWRNPTLIKVEAEMAAAQDAAEAADGKAPAGA